MITGKPLIDASKDEWDEYAHLSCDYLRSKLCPFLVDNFGYKERYVKQHLNTGLAPTINAFTLRYDIYLRLFPVPEAGWPRETLVIARIGFKQQRKGHGRNLMKLIASHASEVGYKYIAIEAANENSSAFGKRFGLETTDNGRSWIGSVQSVQQALSVTTESA